MRRAARIALPLYLLVIYSTLGVIRGVSNALRDAGMLRLTVACVFAAAVLALLGVLWRQELLGRPRTWLTLLLAGAAYTAAIWPMDSPEEKVHFVEYGVVAVLAYLAAPERLAGFRRYAAAAVFTLAAGWLDEGIQALLPERYYDLRDVAFNAVAGVLALIALAALARICHRSLVARPTVCRQIRVGALAKAHCWVRRASTTRIGRRMAVAVEKPVTDPG